MFLGAILLGLWTPGLRLAAVAQDDPQAKLREAVSLATEGKHEDALKLFDDLIRSDSNLSAAFYWRGRSRFCVGKIKESVDDFDRHVELTPRSAPRQWERGIALYYAGQFEKGAKQFELYQTYHDNDVENSTWRFLCTARHESVEAALETMLPIRNDTRIPMMEIYSMYRGEATPDDVLSQARADSPSPAALNRQLFYAHLYIGLYHEANGRQKEALDHIRQAHQHPIDHYMWNVADVHLKLAERESDD